MKEINLYDNNTLKQDLWILCKNYYKNILGTLIALIYISFSILLFIIAPEKLDLVEQLFFSLCIPAIILVLLGCALYLLGIILIAIYILYDLYINPLLSQIVKILKKHFKSYDTTKRRK